MTLQKAILIRILCLSAYTSNADVLLIDVINKEPANTAAGLLRPTNGQSMGQVKSNFGEPAITYPAIGAPHYPLELFKVLCLF
ncbi:MAG: hypothetical protein ABGX28_03525 [Methylococcales bacterium]|jgi:hypothetical protein